MSILFGPELQRLDSRGHLSKFLGPDLPTEIASPDSEGFFSKYGEPVFDWVVHAFTAAESIVEGHEEDLNALAGAAARVRHIQGGSTQSQIVFPSLLSAFAEMAWQDFEGGSRLGRCAFCGETFITDRKWTIYCGPRCATKERQRRFLERNPEYYRQAAPKKGRKAK